MRKIKNHAAKFLNDSKDYPYVIALASGLYPLLYFLSSNLTLVNSKVQILFFLTLFIVFPLVIFGIFSTRIVRNFKLIRIYGKFLFPVLNFIVFTTLVVVSLYGLKKKSLLICLILAFVLAVLLAKHIKKIALLQLIMAIFAGISLIGKIYNLVTVDDSWMNQPDDIENVKFVNKPNIYLIQPDGYVNFSESKKGHYKFDNSKFENFLLEKDFVLYDDYRSNYYSTLSSNSAMFTMKHHYFNNPKSYSYSNELYNARDIIVGQNPVLNILKNNGYKTYMFSEGDYFYINRPEINYDYSNEDKENLPLMPVNMRFDMDYNSELNESIKKCSNENTPNFFFIERLIPGHIAVGEQTSLGKELEREKYIGEIEKANKWLTNLVDVIESNDENAIIIIVADHGGFVGYDFTTQSKAKETNRDLMYSIFSSNLAIKWSNNGMIFNENIISSVNLFRVLFANLSHNEKYLDKLESDKSFLIIHQDAPFGLYEVIDEFGDIKFEKHNPSN